MNLQKKEAILSGLAALFIFLFVYTATSKILKFALFKTVLYQSPVIGKAAPVVAFAIPVFELGTALLLLVGSTRRVGLYSFLAGMVGFTLYILSMLLTAPTLPCSCGGVMASLGWKQHLWLNGFFIVLAVLALKLEPGKCEGHQTAQPNFA